MVLTSLLLRFPNVQNRFTKITVIELSIHISGSGGKQKPQHQQHQHQIRQSNNNNRVGWDIKKNNQLDLVYGDWSLGSDFIVINKPGGIPIQDPDPDCDTVEYRIKKNFKNYYSSNRNVLGTINDRSPDMPSLYFPHRIDKFTSGLLVVALNQQTARSFGIANERKEWVKKYRALSELPVCIILDELGKDFIKDPTKIPYAYRHGERSYRTNCGLSSPNMLTSPVSLLNKCPNCNGHWKLGSRLKSKGILESFIFRRSENIGKSNSTSNNNKQQQRQQQQQLLPPSCEYCLDTITFKNQHPFVYSYFLYESRNSGPISNLAKTGFTLLDVFNYQDKYYCLYDVELFTGKTHQIRIHFSDSGFPLFDDPYYNSFKIRELNEILKKKRNQLPSSSNQKHIQKQQQLQNNDSYEKDNIENSDGVTINMGLQAYYLKLKNPSNGEILEFTLPYPHIELQFTIKELYSFDIFYLDPTKPVVLLEDMGRTKTTIRNCFAMVDAMEKYYKMPSKEAYSSFKEDLLNCFLNAPLSIIMIQEKNRKIKEECMANGLQSIPEYVEMKLKTDPNFNCHLFYEQFHSKGHPTSPFYKVKKGFTKEDVLKYSSEFSNPFETQMIGIHKSKGKVSTFNDEIDPNQFIFSIFPTIKESIQEYFQNQKLLLEDYYLNFVHPWQLKSVVWDEFKEEIQNKEIIIIPDTLTSIIKTEALIPLRSMVFKDGQRNKYLPTIKVSLGVRLTSLIRNLPHWITRIGPIVSRILTEVSNREQFNADFSGKIYFVKDLLGIHFNTDNPQDEVKMSFISSLWREDINKFIKSPDNEQLVAVPALFNKSPVSGKLLLLEFIEMYQRSHSIASIEESILEWFRKYCQLLIIPYLILFCKYGISLEAHHQNIYCIMNRGEPTLLIHKDYDAPRFNLERLKFQNLEYTPFNGLKVINEIDPLEVFRMSSAFFSHFCEFTIFFMKSIQHLDNVKNISEMSLLKETYLIAKAMLDKLKLDPVIKGQVIQDEQIFFGAPFIESYSYNKWRLNPTPNFSNPPLIFNNPWYQFHNNLK
eukprot:gene3143-3930_t